MLASVIVFNFSISFSISFSDGKPELKTNLKIYSLLKTCFGSSSYEALNSWTSRTSGLLTGALIYWASEVWSALSKPPVDSYYNSVYFILSSGDLGVFAIISASSSLSSELFSSS